MKCIHVLFAVAAALTVTAPVVAQDALLDVSSRIVRFDDLNLSNARGRERLEARVRTAANAVCGYREARSLQEMQAAQSCRKTAIARSQPKIATAVRQAGQRLAVMAVE